LFFEYLQEEGGSWVRIQLGGGLPLFMNCREVGFSETGLPVNGVPGNSERRKGLSNREVVLALKGH
jgi:hypothetical protein